MFRIFLFILSAYLCAIALGKQCIVTKFSQVQHATNICTDIILSNLLVPAGKTLNLNLLNNTQLVFLGNTTFEFTNWLGPLITINGTGLLIAGAENSRIDGQGQMYWDGKGGSGTDKPQFFTIQAFNSIFKNIYVLNSPKDVLQITNSDNVLFSNWYIDDSLGDKGVAAEGHEGHHTDGFDIWNSTNVVIINGQNITVSNLWCHGSHGLSISVGFSKNDSSVNMLRNVTIRDSFLIDGENGIHIKTHNDGGKGLITDITYENITFIGPNSFGIQIQQNYPKGEVVGNVPINNLMLKNVHGNVTDEAVPVFILCADGSCNKWVWYDVHVNGSRRSICNYEPENFIC
ncbi:polygalacturonase-like isoform X2 [Anthonomus grandis grandis]|uniref:polygalacturonase-like isoform X2 n=1 Tax=Anthonomus grandis grandis TaxID=2921223 RepID=UPI00216657FB|nr:polygalacturonase-like isoform X2 [Anthonomus grandis grandis]